MLFTVGNIFVLALEGRGISLWMKTIMVKKKSCLRSLFLILYFVVVDVLSHGYRNGDTSVVEDFHISHGLRILLSHIVFIDDTSMYLIEFQISFEHAS